MKGAPNYDTKERTSGFLQQITGTEGGKEQEQEQIYKGEGGKGEKDKTNGVTHNERNITMQTTSIVPLIMM
jgi:hypothetical protein